jgi:uncharacterized protein YkwD
MEARGSRARRAVLVGVVSVTLVLGAAVAPAAASGPETRLLSMLNHVRQRHDLRPLRVNTRLSEDAERHTRTMIRQDRLFDPRNLAKILRPYGDWKHIGASIEACAGTLYELVRRWMGHDSHRAIILLPGLRRAGVGVVLADGKSMCGRDQLWASAMLYG